MRAIEILGLEKTFTTGFLRKKEKQALKPLQLAVEQGEVFGFLGPNGAGKTTTLKLLMGLIFPTAGSACILGKDWRDPGVKKEIGFLPEQPYFYDYLTAAELLNYYAALSGMPAGERSRAAKSVLERVGLDEAANVQLRKYSKGMLQRVGIAQAIIHNPKVVFLDEPTSGLDPMGRREVRDLIHNLKDEGKTVFFSISFETSPIPIKIAITTPKIEIEVRLKPITTIRSIPIEICPNNTAAATKSSAKKMRL